MTPTASFENATNIYYKLLAYNRFIGYSDNIFILSPGVHVLVYNWLEKKCYQHYYV